MPRRFPVVLAAPFLLGAAGCSLTPSHSSAALNHEIAERTGLAVGWPHSEAEERSLEERVAQLLQAPLTPDTAAAVVLLNNRSLRASFEEIGISEAELMAASRLPNPSFQASVRWPDARPRSPNVELNLGMDVLDAFLLPVRKRYAGEQLAETELRIGRQALLLVAQAKEATYTFAAREEFLLRARAVLAVNQAAADLAQRQYDAGNISRLDLLRQQASVQQSQLQVQRTEAELAQDREELNRILGLSGRQLTWTVAAGLPAAPESERGLDQLETVALAQRLDLAAARVRVGLAQSALELKRKTRLLPVSVDLGVDTEREPGATAGHTHVTGPNVAVSLPLFDQGQAELARLTADVRRDQDEYDALVITIGSEVRAARDAVLAARSEATYYDTVILPQQRAILRETLLQYNAMQKSNYELLTAKQESLEAERARIEAWRNYWIAQTHLERAVGGSLVRTGAMPAQTNP